MSVAGPPVLLYTSCKLTWSALKRERFKLIVLSILCKHNVCVAAPSMFTVNGRLCHVCLPSLSHFNPHMEPDANLFIVLISFDYSYTNMRTQTHRQTDRQIDSVSCSTWHTFLISHTRQPRVMRKRNRRKHLFMSVGFDPFFNNLHTNLIQSGSRLRWRHSVVLPGILAYQCDKWR